MTKIKEMMQIIAKLSLSNALKARVLYAVSVWCAQVHVESQLVTMAKEATVSFEAAQKAQKENGAQNAEIKKALGVPSTHIFNAWIRLGLTTIKAEGVKAKLQRAVDHWKQQGKTWEYMHEFVPHVRVSKMYDSTVKRIEVGCPNLSMKNLETEDLDHMDPAWAWLVIKRHIVMQEKGYKEMLGLAPQGDLERKIQSWLDEDK